VIFRSIKDRLEKSHQAKFGERLGGEHKESSNSLKGNPKVFEQACTSETIELSTATVGRAIIYNALSVTLGFLVLVLSVFVGIKRLGLLVAITMS
jgi:hypothetical protein